jgi:hypothetical protein
MTSSKSRTSERVALALLAILVAIPAPATTVAATDSNPEAAGLAGRHYGVMMIARDPQGGGYALDRGCLAFRKWKACADGGDCGRYRVTDDRGRQIEWEAEMDLTADPQALHVEFTGVSEFRGRRSSLAATMFLDELSWNAAISGVEMSPATCMSWALADDSAPLPAIDAAAPVPERVALAGKYYAVTLMLRDPLNGEVSPELACVAFRKHKVCTEAGDCGKWEFTENRGRQAGWEAELSVTTDLGPIAMDVVGLAEARGARSAIAGTFHAPAMRANGGFGGVQVGQAACMVWAALDG